MRENFSPQEENAGFKIKRESEPDAESSFFGELFLNESGLKGHHPFGPEVADASMIKQRREAAQGKLDKLRRSPITKPLFTMIALLAGVSGLAFGAMRERRVGEGGIEETTLQEKGEDYELKRLIYDDLLESGEVVFEREARYGRQSWTPEQAFEYTQIKSLFGKFEYLHKDNKEIVAAFTSPHGRLENYSALFDLMSQEFIHSSLPFEFSKDAILDAGEVFPKMQEDEALALFKTFSHELAKKMGLKHARDLAREMALTLPLRHAILKEVESSGLLSKQTEDWMLAQKENFAMFDQVNGRIEIYHREKEKVVLLDVFPGNGGPASGVAWEPGLPGHVTTRTPDGSFTFDRALEKKSPSWQNSWLSDTAELRWTDDTHGQVDYKDQDGKWRRLTGKDAEFVVYGAPQKPFLERGRSVLYREATRRMSDGKRLPPSEFTVEDALDENGELRTIWDRNDFGPNTIRMKDAKGELMSVFFHSSPTEESANVFLDTSHGCIHMKPEDIDVMAGYLKRGSEIRISSADAINVVAMN
jgi:hypothetical protein